jgi:hypothetical protein
MSGLIKEAIEKVEDLVRATQDPKERVFTIDGIPHPFYSNLNGDITKMNHRPTPSVKKVKSLTGLVDYIKENPDKLNLEDYYLHIKEFNEVSLVSFPDKVYAERHLALIASFDNFRPMVFDRFHENEPFIIMCRSLFQHTEDLDYVVQLASKLVKQDEVITTDDGHSQSVQLRKGISGGMTERRTADGRVNLAPIRTFLEIEQVATDFLLRIENSQGSIPRLALFEADGGIWMIDAAKRIHDFLREAFPEIKIIR